MNGKKKGLASKKDLVEESSLARPQSAARPVQGRVERYAKGKRLSIGVHRYLVEKNMLPKEADLLKKCAGTLLFHYYPAVDDNRLVNVLTCKKHLLCGFCAMRRGAKYVEAYSTRLQVIQEKYPWLKLSMITLTVKNGSDLKERTLHIFKSFGRLNNRRRMKKKGARSSSEFGKVLGLVGAYEVTEKGKLWHPHLHILVLHCEDFDFAAFRSEWKQITGDSHIFRIDPVRDISDPIGAFCEVFKYALKMSSLSIEKRVEAYQVLRTRRLVFSAGLFRGVKIPDSLMEDPLYGLEYIPYFYRFLDDAGAYTLVLPEELTDEEKASIRNHVNSKHTGKNNINENNKEKTT